MACTRNCPRQRVLQACRPTCYGLIVNGLFCRDLNAQDGIAQHSIITAMPCAATWYLRILHFRQTHSTSGAAHLSRSKTAESKIAHDQPQAVRERADLDAPWSSTHLQLEPTLTYNSSRISKDAANTVLCPTIRTGLGFSVLGTACNR